MGYGGRSSAAFSVSETLSYLGGCSSRGEIGANGTVAGRRESCEIEGLEVSSRSDRLVRMEYEAQHIMHIAIPNIVEITIVAMTAPDRPPPDVLEEKAEDVIGIEVILVMEGSVAAAEQISAIPAIWMSKSGAVDH